MGLIVKYLSRIEEDGVTASATTAPAPPGKTVTGNPHHSVAEVNGDSDDSHCSTERSGPFHLVGIGGAGMSGIARLLLSRGAVVTGSDARESPVLGELRRMGARVAVGHQAENVAGAARVIYTAAAKADNPELQEAERRGLEMTSRAAMLGELMDGTASIAVAGTHGKTTTTGMIAAIFDAAGADPTVLIGGDLPALGGNARAGQSPYFIAEACEAFRSFHELRPLVAVVTNVEADHLDTYGSLEGVIESFGQFVSQIRPTGAVILCWDDPNIRRLLPHLTCRQLRYGLEDGAELTAVDVDLERAMPRFHPRWRGGLMGEFELGVPGRHNVLNALAALGVALEVGLPLDAVREGLRGFRGAGRRFEYLGEAAGILVVDDYAHHPTELAATLAAARQALRRPITAVFQPHLFSRTQQLMEEFAGSFGDADRVIVCDIYPAREAPIPGVTAELLAERIQAREPGKEVRCISPKEQVAELLANELHPGEAVLTLGAGDIRAVGEALIARLHAKRN
jgi:UDP-N-acetylmuramate--alanine ligase